MPLFNSQSGLLPDFSNTGVVVIGDVMLDLYYWGDVDQISPEAPVPIFKVQRKTKTLGGAGNVALNLAQLLCQTALLGVRGGDAAGEDIQRLARDRQISGPLVVVAAHPTTTKTRMIGARQQLLRVDEEDTTPITAEVRDQLLVALQSKLPETRAVIVSDYAKGVFKTSLAQETIGLCRSAKTPVFVDPKGIAWEKYAGATCITPNLTEFNALFAGPAANSSELEARAQSLLAQLDLEYLLVTMGPEGMALFGRDLAMLQIPAKMREVSDVSGAGDTVIATLAAARATGCSMVDAARLANTAAGVVVGKLGTQPIDRDELKAALSDQNTIAHDKIRPRDQAAGVIAKWRASGDRVVFTNGCFDILHIGHIKLLQTAAAMGDRLVVGLNSDSSVQRLKGPTRPIMSETSRSLLMANIGCVDLVVLSEADTPIDLIEAFQPDILVKGGDYTPETVVGHDAVTRWGGRVALIPLEAGVSTTQVIEQVNRSRDLASDGSPD
jgi:D-beta-D-heptose 7-phosphate kinase/D-beta-D-heptose 1-phosphate adenosyltransferase